MSKRVYTEEQKARNKIKRRERYLADKDRINQQRNVYYAANRARVLAQRKIYREKNKERLNQKTREWAITHKEWLKLYKAGRAYGVDAEQLEALFTQQHGLCGVCSKPLDKGKDTHIDHCHDTGLVRGLLCHKCNLGLGMLDDNPELLLKAYEYLTRES